jgi:zinc D-Ala-D-Ala dipeptidase
MIWKVLIFFVMLGVSRAEIGIPSDSKQVIFVTSEGWNSPRATVRLMERRGQKGATMEAMTGRNGMAWGLGLHNSPLGERAKREGDGRAPAGTFRLGTGFAKSKQDFAWPCVILRTTHEGVDDPKSRYYNQLVDRGDIANPDWASSEKMKASPHYGLGFWVEHNPKRISGAGSCIYFHEWVGDRSGTAGCTLLRMNDLRWLMGSLDSGKKPVLVQLPEKTARVLVPELVAAGTK